MLCLSVLRSRPADELAVELGHDSGYATAKIDVRGVVIDDHERVLLLREKADAGGRCRVAGLIRCSASTERHWPSQNQLFPGRS